MKVYITKSKYRKPRHKFHTSSDCAMVAKHRDRYTRTKKSKVAGHDRCTRKGPCREGV